MLNYALAAAQAASEAHVSAASSDAPKLAVFSLSLLLGGETVGSQVLGQFHGFFSSAAWLSPSLPSSPIPSLPQLGMCNTTFGFDSLLRLAELREAVTFTTLMCS